jgi:hypothetical protein
MQGPDMSLTIISHFYNEEYLLPWWCEHHKRICDYAILIDYNSTDSSVEIIKDICPQWMVVKTKNKFFDSAEVDKEVQYYESCINGWKVTLNTTEFLYGNVKQLEKIDKPTQNFLGNYVFINDKEFQLDKRIPLHEQCLWGYKDFMDRTNMLSYLYRSSRSIHNKDILYPPQGGRHFSNQPTFHDLWIFYYGYCCTNSNYMINRKLQIVNKMSEIEKTQTIGHPNNCHFEEINKRLFLYHSDLVQDMTEDIKYLSNFNYENTSKCTNLLLKVSVNKLPNERTLRCMKN